MNKKPFLVILVCILISQPRADAQSARIDTVAVSILDKMSATIGSLSSVKVTVNSTYDVNNERLGLVKHSNEHGIYLQGADKLLITSEGDKGSRSFVYDGQTLSYYSLGKNQYAQLQVPGNTIDMIDSMNRAYGIEFPAADFLYPSFVDDILADATDLAYLGTSEIDGKECFHIAGVASDKTFQFWISDDAFYLPSKVVIIYTAKEKDPQYEAVFSDWQLNPSLPPSLFQFSVPPNAMQIKFLPRHPKNNHISK